MKGFSWTWALVMLLASGCGPIQATTAISRAEEELLTAKLAEADQLAPYEYTKADLFLKFAKERQGFAEYREARLFAEEAQRLAVRAKEKAPQKLKMKVMMEKRGLVPPASVEAPSTGAAGSKGQRPGGGK